MINQTHKVGFVEVHSIVDSTDGKAQRHMNEDPKKCFDLTHLFSSIVFHFFFDILMKE